MSSEPSAVRRDSRGWYLVLQPWGPAAAPTVFDRTGHLLARIGRAGDGPGEFRGPRVVAVGSADTLYIFDARSRRLSVVGPDLAFVRSAPVQVHVFDAVLAVGDRLVVAATVPDRRRFGIPLHSLDLKGKYVQSFDEPVGGASLRPGQEHRLRRRLAPSGKGWFWSATEWGEYRVTRWRAPAKPEAIFTRSAAWLRSGYPPPSADPATPPPDRIVGLFEDERGLLYVVLQVADREKWPRALERVRIPASSRAFDRFGEYGYLVAAPDSAYDTVVEVIDPTRGEVLFTWRADHCWPYVVGAGRLARIRRVPGGTDLIEVSTILFELSEPKRGR